MIERAILLGWLFLYVIKKYLAYFPRPPSGTLRDDYEDVLY